jgi:hypothetical protein
VILFVSASQLLLVPLVVHDFSSSTVPLLVAVHPAGLCMHGSCEHADSDGAAGDIPGQVKNALQF